MASFFSGPDRPMFAVIIGIDTYKSKAIQPLRGAVADARAFEDYLQRQLNVPQDRITVLLNKSATRAAFIQGLQRLIIDPRIQRGDLILFFFAGHGSEAAVPKGWEAGGSNAYTPLILPYDVFCKSGREVVAPIPDWTFGALLNEIAQEKSDNIVVIMDSCHSASITETFHNSSDLVRSAALPSGFQLQENLDQDIWKSFPSNNGLRSHVLLSACGPSGQAWESNDRGVFTVALLDLLEHSQISNLRYSDILMRMDIDRQSPHCEGPNREWYIFASTPPLSPAELFIPAFTRAAKNGPIAYIINGGTAHGLVVGDEFAIYPDMDYPEPNGTLFIEELGPFYSIMRLGGKGFPVTGNAVAMRVKSGKRQGLRIYSHPEDEVVEILSLLRDNEQSIPHFVVVDALDDAQIGISMQNGQAIVQLRNTMVSDLLGFRVEPTAEELARILNAASRLFSELDRTADFSAITEHVQVEIYELHGSGQRFPEARKVSLPLGDVPIQNEPVTLLQGACYGLKLLNNSGYDLYPTVQFFDARMELRVHTWYRPASSRSMLDVPLKKDGGSLTIGYGYGGPPSLFIPPSDGEGLGFFKISLFSRPLDPFYQALSFRFARYLPENLKAPWATIVKTVVLLPSPSREFPLSSFRCPVQEYQIFHQPKSPIKSNAQSSSVFSDRPNKGVSFSAVDPGPINERPPGLLAVIWRNSKIILLKFSRLGGLIS